MTATKPVPSVSVIYARTGASTRPDELGMRVMQARAYERRGEQYLLIKSPPASGKSRALMFIALDKLANQGVKQAIICVPEKSIGGSFANEPLSRHGFFQDWEVKPQWNLCNAPGADEPRAAKTNVAAVQRFLESDDKVMVCTHATFRFAFDELGASAFDDRLIAVDEFHHVSMNPDNRLGDQVRQLIAGGKAHIVAMTGSYFRGDAVAVLAPDDEQKFSVVTYTYYEQLNGYEHLKSLDIGYFFYSDSYLDDILKVLDAGLKTIVHIPSVNSRESTKDKIEEANAIMSALGSWEGMDEATGFQHIRTADGRLLKIADLVDDDPAKRDRVINALKNPRHKNDRGYVDIIIALGMAKEGFDWIWCEHALTVGYRSSLTEIIQIIGRATRDAPGKTRAKFSNLIAEPDASDDAVADAVNDTLKAIAASLLMEQVLAPRFNFVPKYTPGDNRPDGTTPSGPVAGFDYGEAGYQPGKTNVGFNEATGQYQIEIKGLAEPKSDAARKIVNEDLNEIVATFVQDKRTLEQGLFNHDLPPHEFTVTKMGKIVRDLYPHLSDTDQESVRQHAIAAVNIVQGAKQLINEGRVPGAEGRANTALLDGVRKFVTDVRELDIDMIDKINPFGAAYAILSKAMNEERLQQVAAVIARRNVNMTIEEARDLARRALDFKKERGRLPSITAPDPWEKRMAEGVAFLAKKKAEQKSEPANG